MSLTHKIICILWSLTFVAFAALQWNDIDPYLWIPIYLVPAVICFFGFREKIDKTVLFIAMTGFLVGAILLWPHEFKGFLLTNGFSPAIEEARESVGLGICFLAMCYLWFVSGKIRPIAVRPSTKRSV